MHLKVSNRTEFRGLVIGMVLGDAWVSPITKRYPYSRLFLGHSLKQEDYLKYKLELLAYLTKTNFYYKKVWNKKSCKYYNSISGQTMTHPFYSKIRRLCYGSDGIKKINRKVLNFLNPAGLAIWYMDDGYLKIDKRKKTIRPTIDLSTCGFTLSDHEVILEYFLDVWGIQTAIHRKGKYYRMYINYENTLKFMDIIEPYVIPSMSYKLVSTVKSGTLLV